MVNHSLVQRVRGRESEKIVEERWTAEEVNVPALVSVRVKKLKRK